MSLLNDCPIFDRLSPASHDLVPYMREALAEDLLRLRCEWTRVQSKRKRKAIYRYLNAVFDLVAWWTADRRQFDYARRALLMRSLEALPTEHPFASVIRCTSSSAKVDKRTRSKWCRVMRYAAECKCDEETFTRFVRRKGGINECARRAKARLGRLDRRNAGSGRNLIEDRPGRTKNRRLLQSLPVCLH